MTSEKEEPIETRLNIFVNKDLEKFLPPDFPRVYPNGTIPLRVQIFNDKKVLHTVLTKPKKGVYMCNHCDKIFATLASLLDHFDQYEISRPYKCIHEDCPWKIVGFNRLRQLNRHESSVHSTEKENKCHFEGCNKSFGRMDLLNRHIKSVHENKKSRFNLKLQRRSSTASTASTTSTQSTASSSLQPSTESPSNSQASSPNHSPTPSSSSLNPTHFDQPTPIGRSSQRSNSQDSSTSDQYYKHKIEFLTD